MTNYSLSHVADHVLLHNLATLVDRDRKNTAALLAHIAEVDARRLYRGAGHPSMHAYCVCELRLSDEAAFRRIRAARLARDYPSILPAVAEGRLHLTAIVLISAHREEPNLAEVLKAAEHKRRTEIEELLAHFFPQPDAPTQLRALPERRVADASTPAGPVPPSAGSVPATEIPIAAATQLSPAPVSFDAVEQTAAIQPPQLVGAPSPRAKVTPLSPKRYALQVTIPQSARDKLTRVQELLSHQLPSGDVAQVFERALDALIRELEKKKCAASDKPRRSRRTAKSGPRYVPADVKRAVWKRDGHQCTFVGENGRRCSSRKFLELDHVVEVAHGGYATVEGMRLRCRAHNQFTAEQTFGAEFMRHKRLGAAEAAVADRHG